MTTVTGPTLTHADAAVRSGERILHHAITETTNDIDAVMATVTPWETLSWTGGWAWSAPAVKPDGSVKVAINTEREGIKNFYLENRARYQVTDIGRPYVRICSDWYAVIETHARFESVPDKVPYNQRWILFAPLDGSEGITGEIAWGRFPQLEPPESVTEEDRAKLYYDYVEALRAQDIDALLSAMSPGVQGAVRDYSGDETFVYIDGSDQMRRYYERLFATVRVRAVDPVQYVDRVWYLFGEFRWQVEFIAGPHSGQEGTLLIAENLPLGSDGRIYGRMGYGTALLA